MTYLRELSKTVRFMALGLLVMAGGAIGGVVATQGAPAAHVTPGVDLVQRTGDQTPTTPTAPATTTTTEAPPFRAAPDAPQTQAPAGTTPMPAIVQQPADTQPSDPATTTTTSDGVVPTPVATPDPTTTTTAPLCAGLTDAQCLGR